MSETVFYMLFLVIAVAFLGALAYTILFRDRRYPVERHTQTDLANMMIMFQTMRDLVQDQKAMARQFNASLDKKVAAVRTLVTSAREEREKLWQAQRRLARLIDDVREELAGVQRQVGYVRDAALGQVPPPRPKTPRSTPPIPAPAAERVEPEPTTFDGYEPDPTDLIDTWTGIDYGQPEPEEPGEEAPYEPASPEDADAARDAFRSLLNFSDNGGESVTGAEPRGNGHGSNPGATLERRVCDYRDAGMEIPDIARELGIERQEVRMILSAREARPWKRRAE
jgi:hypothetical protein